MRDNVDAANIYAPLSPEEIETGLVTTSIFEIQKILMNTVECDGIPDYLKSYQKAQAAALLSHSASGACPSCKSCALVRACAPVSDVKPRKMTSIFKLLASRLTRLGRKTLSDLVTCQRTAKSRHRNHQMRGRTRRTGHGKVTPTGKTEIKH